NLSGSPGETLTAAIQINNASGIKSGAIAITFDPDVLTAQDPQTTSLSSQVDLTSEIVGGQMSMTFNASSTLSGGSGTLFLLPFTIKDNAPEGTYSLTFTEAALIGEDGTNFTVTTTDGSIIVVIEQNIVVSIPDVSGHPGETVHAQIMINDATGIISGDFIISYDPSQITAGDAMVTELTSDFYIVSLVNQGEIRISIASSSAITSGSGALVSIPLTIYSDSEGSSPLSLTNATIYNKEYQEVTITTQDGTLSILPVCIKGDVNNDGAITSVDAALVLQISVGLIEPDEYQICAGDVNDDGEINSLDAALITQCAAGDCTFATGK
ncbi:MAG: cohesin domain-containing protein, partial [Proteobacteria bacterium]|nr:cohesin domain-containing protein [Pseudomonadota bacterium]